MSQRARSFIPLFILLAPVTSRAADIHLKREAVCRETTVRFADVADVYHVDEKETQRWRGLKLFPAPAPGRVREVRRQDIERALQAHRLNLAEVRFYGASKVVVRRAEIKTSPTSKRTPNHNLRFASSRAADRPVRRPVWRVVPVHPIEKGHVLRRSDVMLSQLRTGTGKRNSISRMEEVVGKQAVRSLRQDTPITRNDVQSPRLVYRGDEVRLLVQAGGVLIVTKGIAQDEGGQGDSIEVKSHDERREVFHATVVGIKQAAIVAGRSR